MTATSRSIVINLFLFLLGSASALIALMLVARRALPGDAVSMAAALLLGCAAVCYCLLLRMLRKDDTRQRAAEEGMLSLKLALKAGRFGVWDWDVADGSLAWDDRMLEIYGLRRGDFAGTVQSWQERLHPEDRDLVWAAVDAALSGEREFDLDFRVLHPDGALRYVKAEGSVLRDAGGRALRMIGLNSDVTEQKVILDGIIRERNKAQLYLDIAGVMFAALDARGDIQLINRKGCQILGYPERELLGRNWFELCLPESVVATVKEVFARQMAGEIESVEFFENPILTSSGEERVIAFHNTLLFDETGAICGVLFSGEDITDRKRAEHSLERAASEWQTAMDASPDAIYLLDLDRRLLRANRRFHELTGTSPESASGLHIADILHPGYRGACLQCQAEEAREDHALVLEAGDPENHQGFPVQVALKIVRDGGNNPVSMLVTRHDLSPDRRARQALKESEERYRELVELSQDMILIKRDGRIVFINDAGVRMLGGKDEGEILSRDILDFVHPQSRPAVQEQMEAAQRQMGRLPVIEVEYLRLDGGTFHGEETATAIVHQGSKGVHVFVRDVTNRKNLEAQLRHSQKLEAVGHLAGGIAHDFNNILTVIGGYASLLEMRIPAGDPGRELVAQVLAAADRAANLTRSLLAFSRKQQMHPVDVSLNDIVQGVGKFLKRIIGEDIAFEMELAPGPLTVVADRGQIEQVIINLATNARDAMRSGGVFAVATRRMTVDPSFVETHGFGKPGEYAVVCVSDSGAGMDEATRSKIFEPFFTTKEVGKGTGLGLSIVYGIVRQHKGFIDVTSEPGRGTNFHIYLPLSGNEYPPEGASPSLAELETGTETVLIVEDEAHVRELVQMVLKECGYRTILAADGEDALEKFRLHRDEVKLVFTDLIMPKKSGKELYDEVKLIEPGVKVLFTSGYMADVLQNQGQVDERYEILMKPVPPLELARKVRELLDS